MVEPVACRRLMDFIGSIAADCAPESLAEFSILFSLLLCVKILRRYNSEGLMLSYLLHAACNYGRSIFYCW